VIELSLDYTIHAMGRYFCGNQLRWKHEFSFTSRYAGAGLVCPTYEVGKVGERRYSPGVFMGNHVWFFEQ